MLPKPDIEAEVKDYLKPGAFLGRSGENGKMFHSCFEIQIVTSQFSMHG